MTTSAGPVPADFRIKGVKKMPVIYILNGPNLNLLGKRQPHEFTEARLSRMSSRAFKRWRKNSASRIRFHRATEEYEIIDWVHGRGRRLPS